MNTLDNNLKFCMFPDLLENDDNTPANCTETNASGSFRVSTLNEMDEYFDKYFTGLLNSQPKTV